MLSARSLSARLTIPARPMTQMMPGLRRRRGVSASRPVPHPRDDPGRARDRAGTGRAVTPASHGERVAFLVSAVYEEVSFPEAQRTDLMERSGLTLETIRAAHLRPVPAGDLARVLGQRLAAHVESALLIPYDERGEFYRCKLYPPVASEDGHTQRYHQPADTAPRLYVPPSVRPALADPGRELFVTEGEKKALRAAQEGLACLAIGGLWNWLHDGKLLDDFARIDFCERTTVLVPDSDVWTRTADLLLPVYALGRALDERGARVSVLKLPAGADGAKVGLDDYLCTPGATGATLAALPRLELKHRVFSACATWFKGWHKRREGGQHPSALHLLTRPHSTRRLHPAQDVSEGVLSYALPVGETLVLVTSERETFTSETLPPGLALRHTDVGASVSVTRDAAVQWLAGTRGSVARALDGMTEYLSRHIAFRDRRASAWLAAWALGTWCFRAFPAYPYMHVRSAEKGCGKTRLMELLSAVCFNASPPTAAPTEAFLFREAERRSGTQCLDEADALAGDKDQMVTLLGILNVGYRRGGTVPRLEKQGERFVTIEYEVYAPRMIAGLMGLKDTLASRALPLVMVRRRRDEPIARVGRETAATAARLRDLCALACLEHITDILTAYDTARDLLAHEGIDDRAEELCAPLLALGLVADSEDPSGRAEMLLAVARDLGAARDAAEEETKTARLVATLQRISEKRGERLRPGDLLEALKADGWGGLRSTKGVAVLLGPLGLMSQHVRMTDKVVRAYVLDRAVLGDLAARFCPPPPSSTVVVATGAAAGSSVAAATSSATAAAVASAAALATAAASAAVISTGSGVTAGLAPVTGVSGAHAGVMGASGGLADAVAHAATLRVSVGSSIGVATVVGVPGAPSTGPAGGEEEGGEAGANA
jgi:hypothetical protein